MKTNTPTKDAPLGNVTDIAPVTRELVHVRALELAWIAGRVPPHVSQVDYEQAKRELTHEKDLNRQDALLDSIPASQSGDAVPGPTGREVPHAPTEGEDDEERNESAQPIEEEATDAGREHMLQATRAGEKPDRDER